MSKAIQLTSRFRDDYSSIRGDEHSKSAVDAAMKRIAYGSGLPSSYRDRELSPKLKAHRECYVGEGIVLSYRVSNESVCFTMLRQTDRMPGPIEGDSGSGLRGLSDATIQPAYESQGQNEDPLIAQEPCSKVPGWVAELSPYKMLKLSRSTEDALKTLGCATVGDLFKISRADFIARKGIGDTAVEHLRREVSEKVFTLHGREGIADGTLQLLGDDFRQEPPLLHPIVFQGHLSGLANIASRCGSPMEPSGDVLGFRAALFDGLSRWTDNPEDSLGSIASTGSSVVSDQAMVVAAILEYSRSLCSEADSTEQLMSQCVVDAARRVSPDQIRAFLLTQGIDGRPLTHREVEERMGIRRSSIQHAVRKISLRLDLEKSLRFLYPRMVVLDEAARMGGSGDAELLDARVAQRLGSEGFSHLILFSPDLILSNGGRSFEMKGLPCRECRALIAALRSWSVQGAPLDMGDLAEAAGCLGCRAGMSPSVELIRSMTAKHCAKGIPTSKQAGGPALRPGSTQEAIHRILYDADTPVDSEELANGVKAITGKSIHRHQIPKKISHLKDCMVWGRGEYVHERNVAVREEVVDDMVEAAVRIFAEKDTPIFWVGGLFEKNTDYLVSEGIPNEFALHSILRRRNDPRLDLRVSPWVSKAGTAGERGNLKERFMQVMEEHGNFMTKAEVADFRKRTLSPSYAVFNIAASVPGLEKQSDGWLYTPPKEG